jgi:uncharacterized membrane protein YgcG
MVNEKSRYFNVTYKAGKGWIGKAVVEGQEIATPPWDARWAAALHLEFLLGCYAVDKGEWGDAWWSLRALHHPVPLPPASSLARHTAGIARNTMVSNMHHLIADGIVDPDGTVLCPIVMRTITLRPGVGVPAAAAAGAGAAGGGGGADVAAMPAPAAGGAGAAGGGDDASDGDVEGSSVDDDASDIEGVDIEDSGSDEDDDASEVEGSEVEGSDDASGADGDSDGSSSPKRRRVPAAPRGRGRGARGGAAARSRGRGRGAGRGGGGGRGAGGSRRGQGRRAALPEADEDDE